MGFAFGGGSYYEYVNLLGFEHFKDKKRLLYGCDNLYSPTEFLSELMGNTHIEFDNKQTTYYIQKHFLHLRFALQGSFNNGFFINMFSRATIHLLLNYICIHKCQPYMHLFIHNH